MMRYETPERDLISLVFFFRRNHRILLQTTAGALAPFIISWKA